MLPTYAPGDHVVTFNWRSPKVGDVIVFKQAMTRFIKRVMKSENNMFIVSGDNTSRSKTYKNVSIEQVEGVVFWKY